MVYLTAKYTFTMSLRRGRWGTDCGVCFGDRSDLNISVIPPGRQANNRAELTLIVLVVLKVMLWSTQFNRLVVYSDSRLCVDDINK